MSLFRKEGGRSGTRSASSLSSVAVNVADEALNVWTQSAVPANLTRLRAEHPEVFFCLSFNI